MNVGIHLFFVSDFFVYVTFKALIHYHFDAHDDFRGFDFWLSGYGTYITFDIGHGCFTCRRISTNLVNAVTTRQLSMNISTLR